MFSGSPAPVNNWRTKGKKISVQTHKSCASVGHDGTSPAMQDCKKGPRLELLQRLPSPEADDETMKKAKEAVPTSEDAVVCKNHAVVCVGAGSDALSASGCSLEVSSCQAVAVKAPRRAHRQAARKRCGITTTTEAGFKSKTG